MPKKSSRSNRFLTIRVSRRDLEAVRRSVGSGSFETGDIEALLQVVMMECARSASDDVRAILAEMQAINKRKQRLRAVLQKMKARESDAREAVKDELDGLSEISEMTSLRLQMAMDRRARMMETLSNILKKTSETASSIIQNVK